MISLETPHRKRPHLAWRGEPPGFSRVAAGALDIRRGPQEPALVASGKASPHASCSGASRDSSPVLTWILGYFWSLPRGVSPRLVWGHAGVLSFRAVAAVSRFPSRGSRDLWLSLEISPRGFPTRLSLEAFPRGFPTGLTHVSPSCESILGLKVEAVQGKQVSLECTETSGGLWECWHDPGVPLAFAVESASS